MKKITIILFKTCFAFDLFGSEAKFLMVHSNSEGSVLSYSKVSEYNSHLFLPLIFLTTISTVVAMDGKSLLKNLE